jgi:carbamoyl-phosphate synthase small subunit
MIGRDLVKEVTCTTTYQWERGSEEAPPRYRVVALDCGIKTNIIRMLARAGCAVTVVPAQTRAEEIMALHPHGVVLSNGPGDPAAVPYVVDTVRALIGKLPLFGICLGHQMLGLAFGGKTYKLKFGHRGGNQPVKDLVRGTVSITAQNHGFCIDMSSLKKDEIELTHINLNDHTLEGMRHKTLPVFSVQYHPESSPGPHDAGYLFEEFISMMERWTSA